MLIFSGMTNIPQNSNEIRELKNVKEIRVQNFVLSRNARSL